MLICRIRLTVRTQLAIRYCRHYMLHRTTIVVFLVLCFLVYLRQRESDPSNTLQKDLLDREIEQHFNGNVNTKKSKMSDSSLIQSKIIHYKTRGILEPKFSDGDSEIFEDSDDDNNDDNIKERRGDDGDNSLGKEEDNDNANKDTGASGSKFEFASKLGQQAHDKVMNLIRQDAVFTFEVSFRGGNQSRRGGNDDEDKGTRGGHDNAIIFPPFIERSENDGLGEHGKDVHIPKDFLSIQDQEKRESDYQTYQFDVWTSRMISLHRRLDDTRNDTCRKQTYNMTSLPVVSVVMVFYNEAWTTLLRSVHSILDRTPPRALLEIVLFDDGSTQVHLGRPLEKYLQSLQKLRLIRSKRRLGLIKARNQGFLHAKGEIIVFLDSHIECFPGWLEPLVNPIVLDPRTVTFPIIPNINKRSFGVESPPSHSDDVVLGNVNIHNLLFDWTIVNNQERLYYDSPAMPGGLYAISKEWFGHLGAYDPMLVLWGGENVEISFKVWMCGGRILLSTCSWVGHVFRTKSPLKADEYLKVAPRNSERVAEIWMDQYKHFLYEKYNYRIGPLGDLSVQKDLRRGLLCKSFRWYLDHVNNAMKKQIDSRSVYFGQVTNNKTGLCLENGQGVPSMTLCDMTRYQQLWQLRTSGHLQSYDRVLSTRTYYHDNETSYNLEMSTMTTHAKHNQLLAFDYIQSHRLVNRQTRRCLDVDTSSKTLHVILSVCRDDVTSQVWTLQLRTDFRAFHKTRGLGIEW